MSPTIHSASRPRFGSAPRPSARTRAGYTLVETVVTAGLFVVVFLASVNLLKRDRGLSGAVLHTSQIEIASQDMLFGIERELANAFGEVPEAVAPNGLTADATEIQLDSTLGFPPLGTLVIDRGTAAEERIEYRAHGAGKIWLTGLSRGEQCSAGVTHNEQAVVLWSGLAEPLADGDPDAEDYDGIAMETSGPVPFRGDGTGFSYRVPVDPDGGMDYVDGHNLHWGAELPGGGDPTDGWCALYYQPRTTYDESAYGDDINGDGDTDDVFDVGQIRRTVWNADDPDALVRDYGIGPSAVLQEQCNHGSDLDGDGFDDPMFLWDSVSNELHVRLYLLSTTREDEPILRQVESVMFLRNEPEL